MNNDKLLDVLSLIQKYAEISQDYIPQISPIPYEDDTDLNLNAVIKEFWADYHRIENEVGKFDMNELLDHFKEAYECLNMIRDSALYPLLRELGIED